MSGTGKKVYCGGWWWCVGGVESNFGPDIKTKILTSTQAQAEQ